MCAFLLGASVYSPEGISASVPVRSHEVVSVVWRKASPPPTARERRLEVVGCAFSPSIAVLAAPVPHITVRWGPPWTCVVAIELKQAQMLATQAHPLLQKQLGAFLV